MGWYGSMLENGPQAKYGGQGYGYWAGVTSMFVKCLSDNHDRAIAAATSEEDATKEIVPDVGLPVGSEAVNLRK